MIAAASINSHNVYYGKYETRAIKTRFTVQPLSTYGIPVNHLAHLAGVDLRTARRWKQAGIVSAAASPLVELRLNGNLGAIHAGWQGFHLINGRLYTPEDYPLDPGDLRAIPINSQLIAAQRRDNEQLRKWIEQWRREHVLNYTPPPRKPCNNRKPAQRPS